MNESTDVLVVGAGPAGLALACGLLLHGVRVRVVDQAAGPATTSRANLLHARGVEVLDRLGALGDLPERSAQGLVLTTYIGGRPVMRIRFGDPILGTPRPALVLPQTEIEAALRRRFAELGGGVEWGTGLVDARQDGDGVTAVLGGGRTVRASWLAGCDGAHSTVRKLAGIGFPGAPLTDQWLLADGHAGFGLGREGGHGWAHPDGPLFVMPMPSPGGTGDDLWRLMAYLPGATDEKLDEAEILEAFRRVVGERAGLAGEQLKDLVWASMFRVHRRLATGYRQGRVLLAGDAAHIHSPMGGQGMVTGMGDAENLAWKLALVVHGRAGHRLLDTYQAERRPLAAEVLRSTSATARLQIGDSPLLRLLIRWVLVPLFNRPAVQRRGTMAASQLGVTYRRGPLAGRGSRLGRRPRPGDRVADLACAGTRLHAELGGRWALLATGPGARLCEPQVSDSLGDRVVTLTPDGWRDDEVWLVRPDAHLAWRGRPGSDGLGRWLRRASIHPEP
ncbi:FAD-dependent monooxygenase [Nonomuraea sp. NPDC049486]|uniref:FAD-dependent monooxygenase n=1 Tax=unclassified Nonomuraea TaxID=2593643 RepID=UPI0011CE50EB|nr:FAD-dependent monooxygenase [Nonomuraea sp. C10]TXK41412.1 oxygenase [Nonomuraea sp. C10]